MPISHKIRQDRALLGFAHPDEVPQPSEPGRGSRAQAGNMAGFYAPNSGWLSTWELGIGLLEQSQGPPLVVPLGLRLPGRYPLLAHPDKED